jgi:hypothetical protein
MNGTIFSMGNTSCGTRMAQLVEYHPSNIIGTFWMPVESDDYPNLGCKWIDYVHDDNPAQSMLDDLDNLKDERCLYTHMVIILVGNISNPADYSYVAGITRFFESTRLLRFLADHNIPAHTEVSYPRCFDDKNSATKGISLWQKLNLSDWDEYIRLRLVAMHGGNMLSRWWRRTEK